MGGSPRLAEMLNGTCEGAVTPPSGIITVPQTFGKAEPNPYVLATTMLIRDRGLPRTGSSLVFVVTGGLVLALLNGRRRSPGSSPNSGAVLGSVNVSIRGRRRAGMARTSRAAVLASVGTYSQDA